MKQVRFALALLVVPALLAGCLENGAFPEPHSLGGTLSEDFDQEDEDDLLRRAQQRDAQVTYMESWPMQFDIRPLDRSQCENLRLELEHVDYVTALGDCRPARQSNL